LRSEWLQFTDKPPRHRTLLTERTKCDDRREPTGNARSRQLNASVDPPNARMRPHTLQIVDPVVGHYAVEVRAVSSADSGPLRQSKAQPALSAAMPRITDMERPGPNGSIESDPANGLELDASRTHPRQGADATCSGSISGALHPPPSALKSRTRSLDTVVSLDASESCRVRSERCASRTSLKSRRPAL
jgi:hypothetical protein